MKIYDKNKRDSYARYITRSGVKRNTIPDKATEKALEYMRQKPYCMENEKKV